MKWVYLLQLKCNSFTLYCRTPCSEKLCMHTCNYHMLFDFVDRAQYIWYTSNGSWRQGIKGEMTCTVYVALVWNITYWIMMMMMNNDDDDDDDNNNNNNSYNNNNHDDDDDDIIYWIMMIIMIIIIMRRRRRRRRMTMMIIGTTTIMIMIIIITTTLTKTIMKMIIQPRHHASHCIRIGVFKTKLPGIIDIIETMSC